VSGSALVNAPASILTRVAEAHGETRRDRTRALAQMNTIFREGTPPVVPLDGPTTGQMIAVDMLPGITPMVDALLTSHMPWCGKSFNAAAATGENIFYPSFMPVARVIFPMYRDYRRVGDRVHALPFRTYLGAGLQDPDRQVLKIDYNLPINPRFTMRRILDELVQVDDNYYFGKAHYKLAGKSSHLVFYFALQRA
jgi:hypothetical protein